MIQRKRSNGLRRIVVAIAIAAVVVGAAGSPVAASDDGPPAPPAAFYGDVYVDGEPAPDGTEVVAMIDGEERASTTTANGSYGDSSATAEKLVVSGDESDAGAEITFYVDGQQVDATAEWEAGTVTELDLAVGEVPADDPDEENDGDGGQSIGLPGGQESDDGDTGASERDDESGAETDDPDDPNESDDESERDDESGAETDGPDDEAGNESPGGNESDDESERTDGSETDGESTDDEDETDGESEGSPMPGFEIVGALIALLSFAGIAYRRR